MGSANDVSLKVRFGVRADPPEREEYTWWTYRANARARNIGWRLDYFLISEKLFDRVRDVIIFSKVMGSDHCPVLLDIE